MNILVVATSGKTGLVPPLLKRFEQTFGKLTLIAAWLPWYYKYSFLVMSARFPWDKWWRRWMHLREKTPLAFRVRTKLAKRQILRTEKRFDFVLCLGALHDIGIETELPLFMFCDSTRQLSLENVYDEQSHFDSKPEQQAWLELEGSLYRRANRIFVGSTRVKNSLINYYGVACNKITVSGFGAGLGEAEKCDKAFDGRTILFVGKGDFEKKGGLVLLDAFQKVRHVMPFAELHVVGQQSIPTQDGVINHGLIRDRMKLRDLMLRANVFVLPSLIERFGMTLVEAMAASTPCIVSNCGAMPEIVGDAGIVVELNNAEQLANAIIRVLENQDYSNTLGKLGRERYETIYNWDIIWTVIESEIKNVIGK